MLLHFLVVIIGIFALLSHAALIAPTVLGLPADSLIQNLESQSQPPDDSFTNPSIRLHTFHQNGGPQDDLPITYRNSSHYPVVRLPYASYRPAIHNKHDGYVVYKNIRYARAPTGKYRFAAPAAPETTHGIQDGSVGHSCHQAIPGWLLTKKKLVKPDSSERDFLGDDNDGEDCLFLDVAVPEGHIQSGEKVPVLVWIYGGGFTAGKKGDTNFRPAGFFQRAAAANQSIVFAAMNYRLGAFGFLSGSAFKSQGGQPNAGLLDQRYAMEWIKEHISKFGGDPDRVTVMGESAGGSSILHHLTWTNSTTNETSVAPFNRAIIQSPAYFPIPGHSLGHFFQDKSFYDLSRLTEKCANVTSISVLECLRQVPSEDIATANHDLIKISPEGTFTFGPTVDHDGVSDLPVNLLQKGRFDKNVSIMTSTVGAEGVTFVPIREFWRIPDYSDDQVEKQFKTVLPLANDDQIHDLMDQYPLENVTWFNYNKLFFPVVSPQTRRMAYFSGETFIYCNTLYLNRAYQNASLNPVYSYQLKKLDNTFSLNPFSLPAIHSSDISWTFYDGYNPKIDRRRAMGIQNWILGFVASNNSDPNTFVTVSKEEEVMKRTLILSQYGGNGIVVVMNGDEIAAEEEGEDGRRDRCEFLSENVWKPYGTEKIDESI